jgi:hypothetical protein
MAKTQLISTGYKPRPIQAELHQKAKRFNVLVAHRRLGKSIWAVNEVIDVLLQCPHKHPQGVYMAPYREQAKKVVWQYFKDYTKMIPGMKPNEAELRIDIPRQDDVVKIYVMGCDNPVSFEGLYFDIAVLDEYGRIAPSVWSTQIRATLADRKGKAIFLGTPKGQNDFYKKYMLALKRMKEGNEEWFAAMYKASETGVLPQEELDSMKEEMDEDEFEQEMECSFNAGITGAFYKRQLKEARDSGRITIVPHDPNLEVYTYWDLGISDTMVIWFVQQHMGRKHVIDYFEDSGMEISYYAKMLKEKPYVYAEHVLPHDARARELQSGVSRVRALEDLGIRPCRVLERLPVYDGISAVRQLFPTCWFDAEKCEKGLNALQNYVKSWDVRNKTFSSQPHHNWASHSADGFRCFAMGVRPVRDERDFQTQAETEYDVFA